MLATSLQLLVHLVVLLQAVVWTTSDLDVTFEMDEG
jgi:hypothetical protein